MHQEIVRALELLARDGAADPERFYRSNSKFCPIGQTYGISAECTWDELAYEDRCTLEAQGWTEKVYDAFVQIYDSIIQHSHPLYRLDWTSVRINTVKLASMLDEKQKDFLSQYNKFLTEYKAK